MLRILVTTLVTSLGLLVVDIISPGVYISSFTTAIIAAFVIGMASWMALLNHLCHFLSLPLNVLTVGDFSTSFLHKTNRCLYGTRLYI